jgi:pimeloyl-ACP methyl ester carboxylesterase
MEADMTTWTLTRTAATSAGEVRYDILGEGPPLVLVHGTPTWSYIWRHVAPVLARDYRVYLYDMPGYGLSEKTPDQDVSMGMQGRVLAELLETWGLERPRIAGHDIGGGIVLRAHLLHGAAFERIALLDTLAMRPRGGGRWGTPWSLHVRRTGIEPFAGLPAYLYEGLMSAYLDTAVAGPMDEAALRPFLTPFSGPAGQAAFFRQVIQLDECYTDEVEGRLGEVRAPTGIVWGSEDRWLDIDFAERLAAAIPDAGLTYIPGAGHFVMEDAPGAVTLELRRLFRGDASA